MIRRPARSRRRLALAVVVLALLGAPVPWAAPAATALLLCAAAVAVVRGAPRIVRALRHLVVAGGARRRGPHRGDDAVTLGHDDHGRRITLSTDQLGAHALLVGATGAGKSTTLSAILADRIARGHPVVALDMKGSPAFARALAQSAHAAGRTLRIWTPEGPSHWNPLTHGGPTALKDRLICAERFSEPHYQRAAERYLQTALAVLVARAPGVAPRLSDVVAAMEPGRLAALARSVPGPLGERTQAYLEGLTGDQRNAAAGLRTRLALMHESDAGPWLEPPAPGAGGVEIDLSEALTGGDVVLLSINSSIYGALGAQLGALAVQDLTSAAGRRLGESGALAPATIALDEFSSLGSDNVLSLLARGREAGVGVLLATQELSDLERAGRGFRDQVLGITAVTLAHRQEVHESALAISRMAGTQRVWRETRTVTSGPWLPVGRRAPATLGTVRTHEEPVVHPDVVKRLGTGELVMVSALGHPPVATVRVTPPAAGGRRTSRRAGTRRIGSARRQPPAPGVTR